MEDLPNRKGPMKSHATPREELSIKREIDDIALQTIHQMALSRTLNGEQKPDSSDILLQYVHTLAMVLLPQNSTSMVYRIILNISLPENSNQASPHRDTSSIENRSLFFMIQS